MRPARTNKYCSLTISNNCTEEMIKHLAYWIYTGDLHENNLKFPFQVSLESGDVKDINTSEI